jgi:integrase
MGHIYKRGTIFWIKYYRHGEPFRESAKSKTYTEASNLLKEREGDIARGKAPGVSFEKVMFSELIQGINEDYKLKGRRSIVRAKYLAKFFKGFRAIDITTTEIKKYINHRQKEGIANGTIKLELAALRRMFNLGAEETPPKVDRVPKMPGLEVDNVKEGYFEDDEYYALLEKLPDYMKGLAGFAYWTGWRSDQIRSLTWAMVSIKDRLVTAPGRITKNKKPHQIYMNDPLLEIIKERRSQRNLACPYVFHKNGKKIKSFRFVWNRACRETGIGYGYKINDKYAEKWKHLEAGPTFHDFRRTAVRNLVRISGVSETVAMKITGHKIRSVFDRYDIVAPDDLREAAEKQAQKLYGHKKVTISQNRTEKEAV